MFSYFLYFFSSFANQVLISETMKQNDRQDDEEQLKIHDVGGECFAPHLALIQKSEWHKFSAVGGAKNEVLTKFTKSIIFDLSLIHI